MADPKVVVIGAGHAGGAAVGILRQYGFTGEIVLLGAEPVPPYQRPPLSKAWLKGEADAEQLFLKPAAWYADTAVDLRLGAAVTRIDRSAHRVELADGETIGYDRLIIATGARARRLQVPGAELRQVLALRSMSDGDRLRRALAKGRLVVVGAGYVGLEVAASARALGVEVTVIEREARVLARVACEPLSAFFDAEHRAHGVRIELQAGLKAFTGDGQQLTGVELDDGRRLECDAAVVGIGAIPNDALAVAAGLPCQDGIEVDLNARTCDPDVYAIGDVTRRPQPLYDCRVRLESVPSALEQARQAASAIAGRPPPPAETPWFWSDQFDLKLQIAGLPMACDDLLVRGDPAARAFAVYHLRRGVIRAVEAVNAPADFMMGKQLIATGRPVARDRLLNPALALKEAVASPELAASEHQP